MSRAEPVRRACLALPTGSDPNGRPIVRHYGYHLSLTIVLSSCKPHALRSAAYVLSDKINPCGLEPQLIKLEFIIYLPKLKVVCCYTCTDGLRLSWPICDAEAPTTTDCTTDCSGLYDAKSINVFMIMIYIMLNQVGSCERYVHA